MNKQLQNIAAKLIPKNRIYMSHRPTPEYPAPENWPSVDNDYWKGWPLLQKTIAGYSSDIPHGRWHQNNHLR